MSHPLGYRARAVADGSSFGLVHVSLTPTLRNLSSRQQQSPMNSGVAEAHTESKGRLTSTEGFMTVPRRVGWACVGQSCWEEVILVARMIQTAFASALVGKR
jgi:hypothetical protein